MTTKEAEKKPVVTKKILRLSVVEDRTGLKHSEIYKRISLDKFPKQVRLGKKAVGWLEHEIDSWNDALAAKREGARAE